MLNSGVGQAAGKDYGHAIGEFLRLVQMSRQCNDRYVIKLQQIVEFVQDPSWIRPKSELILLTELSMDRSSLAMD